MILYPSDTRKVIEYAETHSFQHREPQPTHRPRGVTERVTTGVTVRGRIRQRTNPAPVEYKLDDAHGVTRRGPYGP